MKLVGLNFHMTNADLLLLIGVSAIVIGIGIKLYRQYQSKSVANEIDNLNFTQSLSQRISKRSRIEKYNEAETVS